MYGQLDPHGKLLVDPAGRGLLTLSNAQPSHACCPCQDYCDGTIRHGVTVEATLFGSDLVGTWADFPGVSYDFFPTCTSVAYCVTSSIGGPGCVAQIGDIIVYSTCAFTNVYWVRFVFRNNAGICFWDSAGASGPFTGRIYGG